MCTLDGMVAARKRMLNYSGTGLSDLKHKR